MSNMFITTHQLLPRVERIQPFKTALVIVDLQVAFVEPGQMLEIPGAAALLPRVNELIAAVRSAGGSVVFTRHTVSDEGSYALPAWLQADELTKQVNPFFRPGTREHALVAGLDVGQDDCIVDKHRASALNPRSSNLAEILENKGIENVVIAGCATNICCESTARDAHMLGYRVVAVVDAMAARTPQEHEAALINLSAAFADLRSAQEVLDLVGSL